MVSRGYLLENTAFIRRKGMVLANHYVHPVARNKQIRCISLHKQIPVKTDERLLLPQVPVTRVELPRKHHENLLAIHAVDAFVNGRTVFTELVESVVVREPQLASLGNDYARALDEIPYLIDYGFHHHLPMTSPASGFLMNCTGLVPDILVK